MDLDELIRAELTAQAERAPDAHAVAAGVPARARTRRHRRIAVTVTAAAAVVLAAGVPYAVLRGDTPATRTASQPAESVELPWAPTWTPPGLTETNREAGDGWASGRFTDFPNGVTQAVDWAVGGPTVSPSSPGTRRVPVTAGPYRGFWQVSTYTTNEGMTVLYLEVRPKLWAAVAVTDRVRDPRGVALRLGASIRPSPGRAVDRPVGFRDLPAGVTAGPGINAGSTGSADAWAVTWDLVGGAGQVTVLVSRGTLDEYAFPSVPDYGPEVSRTPVRLGDRTGAWVTYQQPGWQTSSPGGRPAGRPEATPLRILEVPMADGRTMRLPSGGGGLPDADLERIAAGAVDLPVDYAWLGR